MNFPDWQGIIISWCLGSNERLLDGRHLGFAKALTASAQVWYSVPSTLVRFAAVPLGNPTLRLPAMCYRTGGSTCCRRIYAAGQHARTGSLPFLFCTLHTTPTCLCRFLAAGLFGIAAGSSPAWKRALSLLLAVGAQRLRFKRH